ncbi:MAG: GMC family oxidoreductase [Myxococcaceae bacterium]|nr:GMC family oxidoreductase [Myxococcaceae bacterium]
MRRAPLPDLSQTFDAVVVGTGPGGATVARELARRGWNVLILERGGMQKITGSMAQALRELWMPGRGLVLAERALAILRAITVGGGSIYSWGTAWDPPFELFDRYGIDLREHAAEAQRELNVAPLPPSQLGPAARRILQSAADLGFDWRPLPKFLNQSRLGGRLMGTYGAPTYDAKWTARVFVSEAVARGATLITHARVRRVFKKRHTARSVEVIYRGRARAVYARKIVLAAGGLGTPVILQASGLRRAGRTLFCDPLVAVAGTLPGPSHGQELPMTAGALFPDDGYLLADLSLPPWLYALVAGEVGRVDRLAAWPHTGMVLVKIRDELKGRVNRNGTVRKPLSEADRQRLAEGTDRAKAILAHAGARKIFHSWTFAAHPGGTAPIGRVVDADLQTELKNLYICDASVIPEPWGLPPALSLIALGKHLAVRLARAEHPVISQIAHPAPPAGPEHHAPGA